MTSL
ncbi:hypothetical protein F383_02288 [Gossypium arboreum]|jgi:alcohol dehydrogenase